MVLMLLLRGLVSPNFPDISSFVWLSHAMTLLHSGQPYAFSSGTDDCGLRLAQVPSHQELVTQSLHISRPLVSHLLMSCKEYVDLDDLDFKHAEVRHSTSRAKCKTQFGPPVHKEGASAAQ